MNGTCHILIYYIQKLDLTDNFCHISISAQNRPVLPSVEPGYLHTLLPSEAPELPEKWEDVMKDINAKIMPGMTHWQSPNFHAYYPTETSYPSIVGEIIASGFGVVGFSWVIYKRIYSICCES